MNRVDNVVNFKDFSREEPNISIDLDNVCNVSNEIFEDILHNDIYPLVSSVQKEYINSLEMLALMGDSIGNDDVLLYREMSMLYYHCGLIANMFESKTFLYHINKLSKEESVNLELTSDNLSTEAMSTANKLKGMVSEFEMKTGKKIQINK